MERGGERYECPDIEFDLFENIGVPFIKKFDWHTQGKWIKLMMIEKLTKELHDNDTEKRKKLTQTYFVIHRQLYVNSATTRLPVPSFMAAES